MTAFRDAMHADQMAWKDQQQRASAAAATCGPSVRAHLGRNPQIPETASRFSRHTHEGRS